jgi:hypothetical protein
MFYSWRTTLPTFHFSSIKSRSFYAQLFLEFIIFSEEALEIDTVTSEHNGVISHRFSNVLRVITTQ